MAAPEPLAPLDERAARQRARRGTFLTLGVLGILTTLIVLLTPVTEGPTDDRLTIDRYGPGSARLLHDLAGRFGWRTVRRATRLTGTLDTTPIYAVFDGPTPMKAEERVAVLDAVRRGAGLLVAPQASVPFALLDSLGLRRGAVGAVTTASLGTCPPATDPLATLRLRTRMRTFVTPDVQDSGVTPKVPWPADARTLLASDVAQVPSTGQPGDDDDADTAVAVDSVTARTAPPAGATDSSATAADAPPTVIPIAGTSTADLRPTMVAFTLGKGRVVALADPDVLRTDQMRSCTMGNALNVMRGLEFLSGGGRRPIVFAEFYQQETTDGPVVVVREWLVQSPLGRTTFTLLCAALVLIAARGRRTLAPVYRAREERRSPLEHVDALATAWQSVRGTRTVARMLARGIRRRHAAGRWRTMDDAEFLTALATRHPAIADDVGRLTRALDVPASPSDLPALRQAAAHIDAECLTP